MKRFALESGDKMQFFLDENGSCKFICVTDKAGAKLQITYKGAHATRPADEIDVDEFVGVKSHRAKGKRLTTYDVDTLTFIEPEEPEEPELTDDEDLTEEPEMTEEMADVPTNEAAESEGADAEVAEDVAKSVDVEAADSVASTLDISDMLDDKDVAPLSSGVKIEIERPHNELDDMINPEQLNLF